MTRNNDRIIDELQAHTGWVRRLARRMVSDEYAAEDLVQEARLAALRSGPREDMRAWLATVVRNLALRWRRSEAIRKHHEREAALRKPTEEEGIRRLQLQRALVDATLELGKPHRELVIQRYYEGLEYAEIARRHGVSETTARKRVSRAVARLRRVVLERKDGLMTNSSLIALAGFPRAVARSGIASITFGGTIMGLKTTAAAATAILIAVIVFAVALRHGEETRPERPLSDDRFGIATSRPLIDGTEEAGGGVEGRSAVDAPTEVVPVAAATSTTHLADLRGRVVDSDGERIAGAQIEVRRDRLREYGTHDRTTNRPGRLVGRTQSDEQGEFVVSVPLGRPLDVWAEKRGLSAAVLPDRHAREFVEIRLLRAATLHGRVTRADTGTGVERVKVQGWRDDVSRLPVFDGHTDKDGAFRFTGLGPGSIRVRVIPRELAPPYDTVTIRLPEGEEVGYDFKLRPGMTLHGTVFDADSGVPIGGAIVGRGWSSLHSVETDDLGAFELRGLPREGKDYLHVEAVGYGRAIHAISYNDRDEGNLDVALTRGYEVVGRIVDVRGQAVPDAYVAAVANIEGPTAVERSDWCSTDAGTDGLFVLKNLRRDVEHTLLVVADGFASSVFSVRAHAGAPEVRLGDLILRPGGSLKGEVVDTDGEGVPNCKVRLRPTKNRRLVGLARDGGDRWSDDLVYLNQRMGRTDDRGQFSFADLADGDYELHVSRYLIGSVTVTEEFDGHLRQAVSVRNGKVANEIRLVLDLGETIAGHVLDPDFEPLAGILVWLYALDPGIEDGANVVTGFDGAFELRGLARGIYRLEAYPTSIGGQEEPPYQEAEPMEVLTGEMDLEVVLEAAALTSGRVVLRDGSPAVRASVVAHDEFGTELGRTFTEPDGTFVLNLPPGTVTDLLARAAPETGPYWNPASFPPASEGAKHKLVRAGTTDLVFRLPN